MVSHPLARSAGPLMARYPLLVRRLGIAIRCKTGGFPGTRFAYTCSSTVGQREFEHAEVHSRQLGAGRTAHSLSRCAQPIQ